eukprot:10173798-Alexandrium_andersonii.AAC.1
MAGLTPVGRGLGAHAEGIEHSCGQPPKRCVGGENCGGPLLGRRGCGCRNGWMGGHPRTTQVPRG